MNMTTTTLTRSALLDSIKAIQREVDVPGIGVVTIKSWTPVQRSRRQATIASMTQENQYKHAAAFAIIDMVVDGNGEPLFTDADLPTLINETSSAKIDQLHDACQEFDEEEAGNG